MLGLGAAVLFGDRLALTAMHKTAIRSFRLACIHFIEYPRSDETPMPLRYREALVDSMQIPMSDSATSSVGAFRPEGPVETGIAPPHTKTTACCRLMQMDTSFAMLMRLSCIGQPDFFFVVNGRALAGLTAIERCTAASICEVLSRSSCATLAAGHCKQRTRAATNDKASANLSAETSLLGRRPGWLGLFFHCEPHVTATVHSHCFALMPGVVTGTINVDQCGKVLGVWRTHG